MRVIRAIAPADAAACDAIVASLPDWFGDETGIRECAAAVRSQQGLVCTLDGPVVGFVTHVRHAAAAAELTWLAVHAEHRGAGHGTALIDALLDLLRRDGVRLLSVKTLAESAGDPGYAETRAFYLARGFEPLIELPDLWDPENPCLLMLRVLG